VSNTVTLRNNQMRLPVIYLFMGKVSLYMWIFFMDGETFATIFLLFSHPKIYNFLLHFVLTFRSFILKIDNLLFSFCSIRGSLFFASQEKLDICRPTLKTFIEGPLFFIVVPFPHHFYIS